MAVLLARQARDLGKNTEVASHVQSRKEARGGDDISTQTAVPTRQKGIVLPMFTVLPNAGSSAVARVGWAQRPLIEPPRGSGLFQASHEIVLSPFQETNRTTRGFCTGE